MQQVEGKRESRERRRGPSGGQRRRLQKFSSSYILQDYILQIRAIGSLLGKIVEIIPACQFVVNIDIGIQVKSMSPGFDGLGSIYGKLGDHMTGPRSGNSSCQNTDSDTRA